MRSKLINITSETFNINKNINKYNLDDRCKLMMLFLKLQIMSLDLLATHSSSFKTLLSKLLMIVVIDNYTINGSINMIR